MDKTITYIGLDVYKDTTAIALAEASGDEEGGSEVRQKITNMPMALKALATKLSRGGRA